MQTGMFYSSLFFVDGFAKDEVVSLFTASLSHLQQDALDVDAISELFISYHKGDVDFSRGSFEE
jgi:hypothetical protein